MSQQAYVLLLVAISSSILSNQYLTRVAAAAADDTSNDIKSNALDFDSNAIGAPHHGAENDYSTAKSTLSHLLKSKKKTTNMGAEQMIASPTTTSLSRNAPEDQTHAARNNDQQQQQHCAKLVQQLQNQFVEQVIRQRVADKDHLLMEKWLVDNINDLHRELKQTEMDFEHYVQVTKRLLFGDMQQNELRRQLAARTSLPLSVPLSQSSAAALIHATPSAPRQQSSGVIDGTAYRRHQYQLTRMFLQQQQQQHRPEHGNGAGFFVNQ